MAELERSRAFVQDRLRPPVDPASTARQSPDLETDVIEPLPTIRRKPAAPTGRRRRAIAALVVGLLASLAVGLVLFHPAHGPDSLADFIGPRWKDESATHFSFAVAADLGERSNVDSIGLAARARASGASFLVALGDLGYPDEASWCREIRQYVPELVIVAGDHDDGEGLGDEVAEYDLACPYTLPSPFVLGSAGYGYEFSFDYPSLSPLARFIMISAGLEGPVSYNYSTGSPHEEWVEDRVADARNVGIPWVIVGVHKQCITVGPTETCSMGGHIFEELVEHGVDLVLVGNDHVYARSKQLYVSDACDSSPWTDEFVPDCVVSQEFPDAYRKGKGTVVVVQGVGGYRLDNVTIDGSDSEIGYFDTVMGRNTNTESRLPGFGSVSYRVTAGSIIAETDFCPPGRVATHGQCLADRNSVFMDRFAISTNPLSPVVSGRVSPAPAHGTGPSVDVTAAEASRPDWARMARRFGLLLGSSVSRLP